MKTVFMQKFTQKIPQPIKYHDPIIEKTIVKQTKQCPLEPVKMIWYEWLGTISI